jgi:hypothetical protein
MKTLYYIPEGCICMTPYGKSCTAPEHARPVDSTEPMPPIKGLASEPAPAETGTQSQGDLW